MSSASLGFLGGGTASLSEGRGCSGGGFFRQYGSFPVVFWLFFFSLIAVLSGRTAEVPITGWEVMVHVLWLPNCGGDSGAARYGGFGASCLEVDDVVGDLVSCLAGMMRSFAGGYVCVLLGLMALGFGFYLGPWALIVFHYVLMDEGPAASSF